MNRRSILRSGALLTGGLAIAGPSRSFGEQVVPPNGGNFNSNIGMAHHTATHSYVASYNQGSVTAAQAYNVASTYATFIAELNSTGVVAYVQNWLNANAAQIQAVSSLDPNAGVSLADKYAPYTYANAQYVAQLFATYSATAKSNMLAANGVWNSLQTGGNVFESLGDSISSAGGTLSVVGRKGQGHFQKIYNNPGRALAYGIGGAFLMVGLFVPGVDLFEIGALAVSSSQLFSAVGIGICTGAAIDDELDN